MKICTKCEIEKDLSEFHKRKDGKFGVRSICKECLNRSTKENYDSEYHKSYYKKYYHENKDKIKSYKKKRDKHILNPESLEKSRQRSKDYYYKNKESINIYQKEYREKNRSKNSDYQREYREKNKDVLREGQKNYMKNKRSIDPLFKLSTNIRNLIKNSFIKKKSIKSKKTSEILGCSFQDFYNYIEDKFDDKMRWDNYGSYWELDHIEPISSAENIDDILRLNHYLNFQPLEIFENRYIKRNY